MVAAATLLVACGGVATSPDTTADSGERHDSGARDDSAVRHDGAVRRDSGSADAEESRDVALQKDTSPPPDAASSCTAAANVGQCTPTSCPSGSVCIQVEEDIAVKAKCVSIPPACAGKPSCACMGREAVACGRPGTPFLDAGIGPGTCQVQGDGGATYLDLPCGCA